MAFCPASREKHLRDPQRGSQRCPCCRTHCWFPFCCHRVRLLLDVMELIGTESLSQRFHFAAQCAHRLPSLTCIVHDDSCHLKAMCLRNQADSPMAARLANLSSSLMSFTLQDILVHGARRHACQVCSATRRSSMASPLKSLKA